MMTRRKWWKILIGAHIDRYSEKEQGGTHYSFVRRRWMILSLLEINQIKTFLFLTMHQFLICLFRFSFFFFCMFVSLYLVISDVRMMSLVIQLEVLKEILVIKLQTKKDLLLLYQVFTINIFHWRPSNPSYRKDRHVFDFSFLIKKKRNESIIVRLV